MRRLFGSGVVLAALCGVLVLDPLPAFAEPVGQPLAPVAGSSTTPPGSGDPVAGEPPRVIGSSALQDGPKAVTAGQAPVFNRVTPTSTDAKIPRPEPVKPGGKITFPVRERPEADPSKLEETPSLRTATRQVFLRTDGLQEIRESSVPVNYLDEKGVWQPIDNHFVADGSGGFVNKANSFKVSLQQMVEGGGIQISAVDGLVTLLAENVDQSVKPVLSKDALTVTYTEIVPGSDLTYRLNGSGLEETLVVKNAKSTPSVTFSLTGAGISKDVTGLRGGTGEGLASRLRISNPDTYDALGRQVDVAVNGRCQMVCVRGRVPI